MEVGTTSYEERYAMLYVSAAKDDPSIPSGDNKYAKILTELGLNEQRFRDVAKARDYVFAISDAYQQATALLFEVRNSLKADVALIILYADFAHKKSPACIAG